jgi:phenylalanyl-tRNA synthetase alpha subunit
MLLIAGLICDYGLTLGDLKGVLEDFFSRLGAKPKPLSFYIIFIYGSCC